MMGRYVGAIVRRREDPRLLLGRGQDVDDLPAGKCLYAAIVRSSHAHARLSAVRLGRAREHPSVAACFAADDFGSGLRPMPSSGLPTPSLKARVNIQVRVAAQAPIAVGTVRYAGEPVAVVLAAERAAAEDAAALVEVEYDPLPVVADVERGTDPAAPLLYPEWGDNVAVSFAVGVGDAERAFADAPIRVRERFKVPRSAGMPLAAAS